MTNDYANADEWYNALVEIAESHNNGRGVTHFESWTEFWETETPEDAYYDEFPEHQKSS